MKFFVKEWDDQTATIMTEMGHVLGYFASVYDALQTCEQWYQHNKKQLQHEIMVHSRSTPAFDESQRAAA